MKEYKQVILLRTDLKMGIGKAAAQVAHASVEAVLKSKKSNMQLWKAQGMKKIVLKVKNLQELHHYKEQAKKNKLTTALIKDAGHTVLKPGTITALAIGPDEETKVDAITDKLQTL